MSLLHTLLCKLRSIIHSEDFFERSRTKESAFTRKRVLGFTTTIVYILWCAKTSLPSTLHAYLETILGGKRSCTRQAFSKRRKLIKPEAFEELFRESAEYLAKAVRPAKGVMRIVAIDGTKANLPTHPELADAFGIQKGTGGLPQALISTLCDVENRIALDVQIRPHNGNEREMAKCHIQKARQLMGNDPLLVIYDRGYPSAELLETMITSGIFYLMRCPTEFVRSIDKRLPDCWVIHKFHSFKHALTFRVIRSILDNGTEEILCTNLSDCYSASELVDLYSKRWRIEINYDFLKNRVQLENLSGITLCAFMQQLYACLLMCNLCGAYYCDNRVHEIDADSDTKRKCDRRINMATVLGAIRSILPRALVRAHSCLSSLVKSVDVRRVKNIFRYDKNGRDRPRKRLHPSMKFTQSQRAGF